MEPRTGAQQEPARTDLNRASQEVLARLPGIGSTLAARIVAYREEHGPFLFEDDLTEVQGISDVTLERLRDRITVSVPSSAELAPQSGNGTGTSEDAAERVPTASSEEREEEPATPEPPPLPTAEPSKSAEAEKPFEGVEPSVAFATASAPPVEPSQAAPASAAEQAAPTPSEAPPEAPAHTAGAPAGTETAGEVSRPELGSPAAGEARQAPFPRGRPAGAAPEAPRRERAGWGWLWSALLGAFLGGIFGTLLTLLILWLVNGSIDMRGSRAVMELQGQFSGLNMQVDAMRGDVSALQSDVEGLRQQVDVLSGLTARVEDAEAAVTALQAQTGALEKQTAAIEGTLTELGVHLDALDQTVASVQAQTEKAMSFFDGLRALLDNLFGQAPSSEATPAGPIGGGL